MADEHKTDDQIKAEAAAAKSKMEFSPEQQAKVQELIDGAYQKAYAKAIAKTAEDLAAKEKEKGDMKGKDTSLLTAQMDSLKKQVENLRGERKKVALFGAISKHNVIDASEIAALTEQYVRLNEDNSFTILNEQGVERLNAQGKPMMVEEFMDEWVSKRPHHLRASAGQGAGSAGMRGENGSGQKMSRAEFDKLSATAKRDFALKSENQII